MTKDRFPPALVAAALVQTHGNQRAAARLLHCSNTTVYKYVRRYPVVAEACAALLRSAGQSPRPPRAGRRRFTAGQVAAALRQSGGSQAQAARRLGCSEGTIARYRSRFASVAQAFKPETLRGPRLRFTPEEVVAALEQAGGVQEKAARLLHCGVATIAAYRARFPLVREAYEHAWRERGRCGRRSGSGSYLRFTPEQVAAALLQARGLKSVALESLHCCLRTLNRHIERYPVVRAALKEARENQLDAVESQLAAAVDEGELPAVKYVLGQFGKDRGYDRNRPLEPSVRPSTMPRSFPGLVRRIYAEREAVEKEKAEENEEPDA